MFFMLVFRIEDEPGLKRRVSISLSTVIMIFFAFSNSDSITWASRISLEKYVAANMMDRRTELRTIVDKTLAIPLR
jgi:hypothetical protein